MADKVGKEDKPKGIEQVKVELLPVGEPSMGRVYANYVQISHTPWEFTIRFCLAPASADIKKFMKKGTNIAEIPITIDVMLSPALMQPIIQALQTNLEI